MATLSPNISITLSQQHLTCVLDPSLVLSNYGLSLAKHLREVMELWVVRELWYILDNPQFYLQQPESLLMRTTPEKVTNIPLPDRQELIQALQDWECMRMATDPTSLNLFWIGDQPGESYLPARADPQLIWRWESLACSLDNQLKGNTLTSETLALAFRDAAALATALNSAFILTYQLPEACATSLPPDICVALETWGIPCREIYPLDAIATIERDNLRRLIVQAGLSKLLWAGLHLAVLHLVVPSASALFCRIDQAQETRSPNIGGDAEHSVLTTNLWQGAQGFWYRIAD
jgi:hypothetical protein